MTKENVKMIELSKCKQVNEVHSEYEALFSVIYPILLGLTYTLKMILLNKLEDITI